MANLNRMLPVLLGFILFITSNAASTTAGNTYLLNHVSAPQNSDLLGVSASPEMTCAVCTVFVSMGEQYAEQHHIPHRDVFHQLCGLMFKSHKILLNICTSFIDTNGKNIFELMDSGLDADKVCQHPSVHLCKNPKCNAWSKSIIPPPPATTGVSSGTVSKGIGMDFFQWILHFLHIDDATQKHIPVDDDDGDKYAYKTKILRGEHWRGSDCEPHDSNIHPGARDTGASKRDYNCNGVYGSTPNYVPYEKMYCNETYYDMVIIGDSMGARFSFPPKYLLARSFSNTTFNDIATRLGDEFCLPHNSWATGYLPHEDYVGANYFVKSTQDKNTYSRTYADEREWLVGKAPPQLLVDVDSLYMRYRERNRCAHRQFQNCAVSGGKATSTGLIEALSSNPAKDQPKLVTMEFVGNDVCSSIPGFDAMTTPAQFKASTLAKLEQLDKVLPKGSKVIAFGVLQEDVHWPALSNHTHPLGMTYERLYEYLICLDLVPCWGYMHPRAEIRAKTAQRAAQLQQALYELYAEKKNAFSFEWDAHYVFWDCITGRYMEDGGRDFAALFEPADGFHMNQLGMNYVARCEWELLEAKHPDWLGKINPHNYEIRQKFGDQGGDF